MQSPRDVIPPCVSCGKPTERERWIYDTPICFACLPPPEPLPIRWGPPVEAMREAWRLRHAEPPLPPPREGDLSLFLRDVAPWFLFWCVVSLLIYLASGA